MPKGPKNDKLKYLYARTDKGKDYLYFRMADGKLIPLPLDQESVEFKKIYDTCLKVRTSPPAAAAPEEPRLNAAVGFIGGSIGKGIEKYRASNTPKGFLRKKPKTKRSYGFALDIMRDRIGSVLLRDMDINRVDRYTESLANEFGDATADLHRALLSLVWQTCRKFPEFKIEKLPNPCREATKHYTKAKVPHRAWTDEQIELFDRTAPQRLKDAILVLEFTDQRGGDCCTMKWTDFDGVGLTMTPEKTDGHGVPKIGYLKCPKPLLKRLLQMRKERGTSEYILTNMWGNPWASSATLGNAIRKHLFAIGLAKPFEKTISMHGLRKTTAKNIADLQVGTRGIKAVSLLSTDKMANHYAEEASQKAANRHVVDLWDAVLEEKAVNRVKARRANMRRVK